MPESPAVETAVQRWQFKIAAVGDVEPTLEQLADYMNDKQRQDFRDKLQRYVQKPDRDLILAVNGAQILGLVCVLHQAEFPPALARQKGHHLRDYACGTQLLVQPSFRRRGIGASLHSHAESWARKRGLAGFWVITHRMADWYERNFGYNRIARIEAKGVRKTILAKKF